MKKIFFRYADKKVLLNDKLHIREFVETLFEQENMKLTIINYIFCSDDYLLQINKSFLQHDFYTDIITFNLSENKNSIIGEIYISVDRVKENALEQKTAFQNEMLRVIFHGALHLCGYKDKSPAEKKKMTLAEDKYLKLYLG